MQLVRRGGALARVVLNAAVVVPTVNKIIRTPLLLRLLRVRLLLLLLLLL